jgi:glycyl-tRNA synthetase beta chain
VAANRAAIASCIRKPVHVADADSWLDAMRREGFGRSCRAPSAYSRRNCRRRQRRPAACRAWMTVARRDRQPHRVAGRDCLHVRARVPRRAAGSAGDHDGDQPEVRAGVRREGKLTEHFIGIANIDSKDPAEIRKGYERVIRPRFADAKFFWDEDLKTPLAGYRNS